MKSRMFESFSKNVSRLRQCTNPHLPENMAHDVIISAEIPEFDGEIVLQLKSFGINPIYLKPCDYLPKPVRCHPDMCMFMGAKGQWSAYKNAETLIKHIDSSTRVVPIKIDDIAGETVPENNVLAYPYDAALDCLMVGKHLFCGKGSPQSIISEADECGIQVHLCRQGYVKCSVCVVGEDAFITEDKGIAALLKESDFDVLLIEGGEIALPGHNCGFIGGASFKIKKDMLVFFGCIENHSKFDSIKNFCLNHGVRCISLSKSKLTDFGGAMCLTEKTV